MSKLEIPPGHVVVRLADLAELLAARSSDAPQPAPYAATWPGLTAATGMLTGHLGGHQVDRAELARGTTDEAIIGALVTVGAGLLRAHHGDSAETLLQYLGLIAASCGTGPNGEAL
jgi:hypothetical protein